MQNLQAHDNSMVQKTQQYLQYQQYFVLRHIEDGLVNVHALTMSYNLFMMGHPSRLPERASESTRGQFAIRAAHLMPTLKGLSPAESLCLATVSVLRADLCLHGQASDSTSTCLPMVQLVYIKTQFARIGIRKSSTCNVRCITRYNQQSVLDQLTV